MALTKVGKEGITGISNSSDANAITIDSSETVMVGATSKAGLGAKVDIVADSGASGLTLRGRASDGIHTQRYTSNDGATEYSRFQSRSTEMRIQTIANIPMRFDIADTEKMRLTSSGLDLSAGNLVLDNGYGIDFSATANSSGTVTHEILDDYEIGTFTPHFQMGLTSPGYSVQQGTYVKIGSLVVCSIYLRANSGTENGDHIYVGGLPFTVITGGSIDHQYGAFFTYNGGFWTSDANTQWLALKNQTNLAFYKQADGGAIQGTTSGVATNLNADLRLVAVYRS